MTNSFWTFLTILVLSTCLLLSQAQSQFDYNGKNELRGKNELNSTPWVKNENDDLKTKEGPAAGHFVTVAIRKKRQSLWETTTRGTSCDGRCRRHGTDYYWCRTKRWSGETSWDYCSPWEGIDYYGNVCQQPCGFQGYSYKWCYVTTATGSSTWGYCSTQSSLLSYNFP